MASSAERSRRTRRTLKPSRNSTTPRDAPSTAAEQIDRFLRDNPVGSLEVVVGFASAFGLRWLAERSEGREVRLLIGDIRAGFSRFSEPDRVAAVRFIRRGDVQVVNWYRRRGGHRTAHAKTWMVKPAAGVGTASEFLVGSANLTRKGLFENVEMMTRPHPDEHDRLRADMSEIMRKSWPIEDKLLRKLEAGTVASGSSAPAGRAGSRTAHAPARRTSTPKRAQPDARSAGEESSIPSRRRDHFLGGRSQRTKRGSARRALFICGGLTVVLLSLLFVGYFLLYVVAAWLTWVGL